MEDRFVVFLTMTVTRNAKRIKNAAIVLGILFMSGFFVYSLVEYRRSGIARDGVVACANGHCLWSAHRHIYIPIQICDRAYHLTRFTGPLSGAHTHGEESVIHWHDTVRFDPEKKSFLQPSPFVLRTSLENQGIQPDTDMFFGKRDGDECDGKRSTWKTFLNGAPLTDWLNYEWRDRDIIFFVFDSRTAEEVEEELRENPLRFPPVGEG